MSNPTTTTYPEPSGQECLAEDGTPTERLLRLTELTLLLTPAREAYGDPIPRRRAQRAADYADAWADDITLVEVTPAAPWVHRSVSYPTIINTIGHVACAVDHLGDGRTSSPQLCYVLRALAANVRTFAGLESPPVSDSDPQRDHPHTPPTSQETAMTTTPQRYTKRPVTIEAIQWDGTQSGATPIIDWILDHDHSADYWAPGEWDHETNAAYINITTLEGNMIASRDDWIIRGVQGEFYPCKPDIFEVTYQPAG